MNKANDKLEDQTLHQDRTRIVFLSGLSCSGKSTIGAELALRLNWKFIDTDKQIEKREGQLIREIFDAQGEERFREIETEVIRKILSHCAYGGSDKYVVALGGGALMSAENVMCVKEAGLLVFLEISCEAAAKRLHGQYDRPLALGDEGQLLSVKELTSRIELLLEDRNEGFSKSDHTVNSASNSISATCEDIRNYIKSQSLG